MEKLNLVKHRELIHDPACPPSNTNFCLETHRHCNQDSRAQSSLVVLKYCDLSDARKSWSVLRAGMAWSAPFLSSGSVVPRRTYRAVRLAKPWKQSIKLLGEFPHCRLWSSEKVFETVGASASGWMRCSGRTHPFCSVGEEVMFSRREPERKMQ